MIKNRAFSFSAMVWGLLLIVGINIQNAWGEGDDLTTYLFSIEGEFPIQPDWPTYVTKPPMLNGAYYTADTTYELSHTTALVNIEVRTWDNKTILKSDGSGCHILDNPDENSVILTGKAEVTYPNGNVHWENNLRTGPRKTINEAGWDGSALKISRYVTFIPTAKYGYSSFNFIRPEIKLSKSTISMKCSLSYDSITSSGWTGSKELRLTARIIDTVDVTWNGKKILNTERISDVERFSPSMHRSQTGIKNFPDSLKCNIIVGVESLCDTLRFKTTGGKGKVSISRQGSVGSIKINGYPVLNGIAYSHNATTSFGDYLDRNSTYELPIMVKMPTAGTVIDSIIVNMIYD